MTKKQVEAARRAKEAAKRAKEKLDILSALQKEEHASKLAVEAARDLKEAQDAAAEIEAEALRQLQLHQRLKKENPTLWAQFKGWFS